jgi:hypothetical protein
MASYRLPTKTDRDPQWSRIRTAILRANPGFHDAPTTAVAPGVRPPTGKDPPLVGDAYGRLWLVTYRRASFFYPAQSLSVITAIRWDDPERLILYETPWLYLGGRPRIFGRMSPDLERILERQKRIEKNLVGHLSGDPEFDRRWAFYVYRARPAEVLKDPARRRWLETLDELRPGRGDEAPTIASLGTNAALNAAISDSDETVRQAGTLVRSFAELLDAIEQSTGNRPASQVPLTMDFLPDGSGYPSPTLRFRCASCGQETHPRFVPDFQTEICDRCRKGMYSPR